MKPGHEISSSSSSSDNTSSDDDDDGFKVNNNVGVYFENAKRIKKEST